MEQLLQTVLTWVCTVGVKILISLCIVFITFKMINTLCKRLKTILIKKFEMDKTLTNTLSYVASIALKGLVLLCLVGYLGIETSGISAVIASLGVCAGLAVNGTLSNLAGGVMILMTRPFSVGDYISAQGCEGVVENIYICNTKIITVDNKTIYLPNSALSTGTIVNFSERPTRRLDLEFSIAGNDPSLVRAILLDVCDAREKVLKDPAPFARVSDYGAGNGVKMSLRVWCNTTDYWDVYFDLLEKTQSAFEAKGIVIPFNQLDVHVKDETK
ncbi:MAG: mechanosensitive ion channel [Firmicutes bacterium]|nr:mechanosensitive ion channel [Bacillota bacterium]